MSTIVLGRPGIDRSKHHKRAIFFISAGGTGNSYLVRALLGRHRREGRPSSAYDCDGGNGSLVQVYGERGSEGVIRIEQNPLTGVMPLDILHPAQRKFIYEAPMTGASVQLFDIPGGQMGRLLDSISNEGVTRGERFVRHFEQYGYAVTFVVAITNHEKSVISLGEVLDTFGDMVDYVAVKNLFFEQYPGGFPLWDGGVIGGERIGGNKKALLLKRGGKAISMPALSQHVVSMLQALHLRFEDARWDARLRLLDRSRVIQWIDRLDEQFDQAGDYLGLTHNKK